MRDRLIELLQPRIADLIENIKGVEDVANYLLENGVVCMPCKVGDTVYAYNSLDHTYKLRESTVKAIKIQKHDMTGVQEFLIEYFYTDKLFSWSNQGIFGKTVFLSKEEAEKHLQEDV